MRHLLEASEESFFFQKDDPSGPPLTPARRLAGGARLNQLSWGFAHPGTFVDRRGEVLVDDDEMEDEDKKDVEDEE